MKTITLLFIGILVSMGLIAFGCQKTDLAKEEKNAMAANTTESKNLKIATFAGGCFWCSESDFEKVPGVVKVISGYTGGKKENPTYEEVTAGKTGHVESIQVTYDPEKVSYETLLGVF